MRVRGERVEACIYWELPDTVFFLFSPGLLPVSIWLNARCPKVGNDFCACYFHFATHWAKSASIFCICSSKLNKLSARFPFLHATLHAPPFAFLRLLFPSPYASLCRSSRFEFWANLLANSIIKSNINQQISGLASRRTCLPTGAQPSPVPSPIHSLSLSPTVPSPAQSSLAHLSSSGAQINELSWVESG